VFSYQLLKQLNCLFLTLRRLGFNADAFRPTEGKAAVRQLADSAVARILFYALPGFVFDTGFDL
jgi:hypothetical protein